MFPIINIGPLAVQTPGLLIIIGVYIFILIGEKQSLRYSIKPNDLSNIVYIFLLSTILIGRLAYVFRFPTIFIENPISLLSINLDLFDFASGLLLSLLVVMIFMQRKNINIFNFLDAITYAFLVLLIFFFLAQFAAGNLYGKPSDLPWAINLWGAPRHPLQLYYLLGLAPIFFLTFRSAQKNFQSGILFARTICSVSILVIFLDFFNGNSNNVIANFNTIQISAWTLMVILLVFINKNIANISSENSDWKN
ncbi:MAG: prolipoprotein diacylglyceryl transferase [Anaerolineaceae bacterium]|nr:prolipoprotein diacylglyceryl transferase [Anaerolineaceae bacterium]